MGIRMKYALASGILARKQVVEEQNRKLRTLYDIMHCRGSMQSLRDCMEDLWWMIFLSHLWKYTKVTQVLPFCLDMGKAQAQPLPCLL